MSMMTLLTMISAEGVPEPAQRGAAEYIGIAIGAVVVVIGLIVAQVRRNRGEE